MKIEISRNLEIYWYQTFSTSSEPEYQMESWFLLNVVIWQASSIFKLLSGENESLLVWGDTFLVLDLSLDSFDWVRWLDIESDGLSGQSFDEDLHLLFFNFYKSERCLEKFKELVFWCILSIVYFSSEIIRTYFQMNSSY